jgi:ferredoxin-thioredoxin reductase catalytic subunit
VRASKSVPARHRWKWSGTGNGFGTCKHCGLKTKVVKRVAKKRNRYGDLKVPIRVYLMDKRAVEEMPPCSRRSK